MKILAPSDELHFLRWFWKNASGYVQQDGTLDRMAALIDYEVEFQRHAPNDHLHALTA